MHIEVTAPDTSLISLQGRNDLTWRLTGLLRQEAVAAFLFALILVTVTLIPDLLGFAFARPGTVFMETLMNPEDTNSYLAKMQQGYEGFWLYTIPFTSKPHSAEFLGGFYILLGQAARPLGFSILQMWYVARVVSALCMFLIAWSFIRSFLPDVRTRWIAYFLALTGSGLGWALFAVGQSYWLGDFPVDFKMAEAHLFFTALAFPHFAAGVCLIIGSLWLSFQALVNERTRYALVAGAVNLALAVVYPFLIYLIAAVLILYWLNLCLESKRIRWRSAMDAAASLAIPMPLLVYYFVVLRTNPVFQAWDAQAVTLSPNPLQYLVAYGVMMLLAVPTLVNREMRPLWLWVLAVCLLVYAPLNPQRRFVEGVQVPLSILAAAGLVSYYLPRLRSSGPFKRLATLPRYSEVGLERFVVLGVLLLLSVSNVYVLMSMSFTAAVQQPYPFFRPQAEVEAVDWAGANLPSGSIILSAYETGSLIPTRSGLRTVIGHWAETIDFERTYDSVSTYFAGKMTESQRSDLLRKERVSYVFFGPRERSLGDFHPDTDPRMTPVYDNSEVTIFRAGD